ncbi:MAG: 2-C-methyl-D-erythritol 4-phosphate cytidylyltransferase [Betaproteobacteria bacterium]
MSRYLAVIPAAGSGIRMGATQPKQYLPIGERPLLYYAVARLCAHPVIDRVCVVLALEDRQFGTYDWSAFGAKLEALHVGGKSRAASVLNALEHLHGYARSDDWILVHDAARPCLSVPMLDRLLDEVGDDETGGLLAMPVADTLKRADGARRSMGTEPRAGLWQAQTPQMFRYALLLRALRACDPQQATDEAAAVEALGLKPRLVQSDATNLKVTHTQDLALTRCILNEMLGTK